MLGFLSWLLIGVIVGFIGSKVVNLRGDDPRLGIGATAAGAIIAGAIATWVSEPAVGALNLWGLLWAAIGAVMALAIWHLVRSRFISHASYAPRQSY